MSVDGPSCTKHSSAWPCDQPVTVRELLGLGPPYYFGIVPKQEQVRSLSFAALHKLSYEYHSQSRAPDCILPFFGN